MLHKSFTKRFHANQSFHQGNPRVLVIREGFDVFQHYFVHFFLLLPSESFFFLNITLDPCFKALGLLLPSFDHLFVLRFQEFALLLRLGLGELGFLGLPRRVLRRLFLQSSKFISQLRDCFLLLRNMSETLVLPATFGKVDEKIVSLICSWFVCNSPCDSSSASSFSFNSWASLALFLLSNAVWIR